MDTTPFNEVIEPKEADQTIAPMHVLIVCPNHGGCSPGFTYSVARAMTYFSSLPYEGEKSIDLKIIEGSILPEVRTRLVSYGFDVGATHLMWFDCDMSFPPDTIVRLMNHNLPVVAGNYARRNINARPAAFVEGDDYIGPLFTKEDSEGLVEVKQAGMGCMLTDIRLFERLQLPFFKFEPMAPDFVKQMGEDVYFCRKVAELGIKIFVDQDLSKRIGHFGSFEYTHSFSMAAQEAKLEEYAALPVS